MTTYPIQEGEGYLTRFQYGLAEGSHNLSGTADAITNVAGATNYLRGGTYYVTGAAIDAITLVPPISGGGFSGASGATFPQLLGQDDMTIVFVFTTAYAHTVTTSAVNQINGNKHIATSSAAVGNILALRARTGIWWMLYQIGMTLS
jgi:hypothetical protein